jgi:hypothetical protein
VYDLATEVLAGPEDADQHRAPSGTPNTVSPNQSLVHPQPLGTGMVRRTSEFGSRAINISSPGIHNFEDTAEHCDFLATDLRIRAPVRLNWVLHRCSR